MSAALVRWCGKVGALVALAFFVVPAQAHYDGDDSQPQHRYRYSVATPWRDSPVEACGDETHSSATHDQVIWNAGAKNWSCRLRSTVTGDPVNVTMSEDHCTAWDMDAPDCTVSPSRACAALRGITETWDSNRTPFGFNVPDDSSLPAPWDTYRGCSMRIVGFTNNQNCTRVTYEATGAEHIDEDGRPTAIQSGDPYAYGIPPNCDPATGDTTDNVPQASSTSCAQRAGNTTQIHFSYNDQTYTTPPDPPAWSCIRGCKAIPATQSEGGISLVCLSDAGDADPGSCLVDYRFPFEDEPNYGLCLPNTEASSNFNPGVEGGPAGSEQPGSGTDGGSGGGGTDVSGVEDRLDQLHEALTECDVERGDICSEGDISDHLQAGEAGLDAMDGVAEGDLGRDAAQTLKDGNQSGQFTNPASAWAAGAGGACQASELSILGTSMSLDFCDFAQLSQQLLYWAFNVMMVFYLFNVWVRLAGSPHVT